MILQKLWKQDHYSDTFDISVIRYVACKWLIQQAQKLQ